MMAEDMRDLTGITIKEAEGILEKTQEEFRTLRMKYDGDSARQMSYEDKEKIVQCLLVASGLTQVHSVISQTKSAVPELEQVYNRASALETHIEYFIKEH
jgi:hypothetical protein